MAQKDLVELLRQIGEKRAGPAEWNKLRKTLSRIDLVKADLSNLELPDINLGGADLSNANLFNTNLSGADLSEAALTYADLRRANLANTLLRNSNLSGAHVQGANLVDTDLRGALLQGTHLSGAYLVGAILTGADMTDADLRGANCKFANFTAATITNVNVEDADLTQVEMSEEQHRGLIHADQAATRKAKTAARRTRRKTSASETYDDLFPESDAFAILGIKPGATPEEITHAYRKRVKEYHPDRVAHLGVKLQEVARREFDRVQLAYEAVTRRLAKPYITGSDEAGMTAEESAATRSPESLSLEEYQSLANRYPYNDRIIYNLGVKYYEAGMLQPAADAFEKAIGLNPGNALAQHNLKVARLLQQLSE